jgi:hypothetical protein
MQMGHRLVSTGYYGGYQAIMYDTSREGLFWSLESRKDSAAAGRIVIVLAKLYKQTLLSAFP